MIDSRTYSQKKRDEQKAIRDAEKRYPGIVALAERIAKKLGREVLPAHVIKWTTRKIDIRRLPVQLVPGSEVVVDEVMLEAWLAREVANRIRRRANRQHAGYVYFIQAGDGGPIKIGSATDVEQRMSDLQVGSAQELRLLAKVPGGYRREGELHDFLSKHHIRGEWFQPHEEVFVVMAGLVKAAEEERTE